MSPIFRRNKKQQTRPDQEMHIAIPSVAQKNGSNMSEEKAQSAETQKQSASSHPRSTGQNNITHENREYGNSHAQNNIPNTQGKSQEEFTAGAYRAWKENLEAQIENDAIQKSEKPGAKYFGQIDITQVHPTGAAQFYTHMQTRLSSLIREPKAYARAKTQLAQLQELTRQISEEYGCAPISLAAGRFTWTELPHLETQELPQWNEQYEITGELRLDFTQLNLASGESHLHQNRHGEDNLQDTQQDTADDKHEPVFTMQANRAATSPERPIKQAKERTVPALLRGLRVEFLADGDAKLKLSKQAVLNPEIIAALRLAGIEPERIAKLREMVQLSSGIDAPLEHLAAIARAYLPGFKLENQNIIGCFHAPPEILLADLEAMSHYIHNSGIVAALAGDEKLRKITGAPIPPGNPSDRFPEAERGIGDLDTEELNIVEAVASGRSIVIDAPAGTQRFETLASIVADTAASGKSLIYVPTRASSGTALKAELEKHGLGEMVLDFSDIENVPQQIRTGLRLKKPAFDLEKILQQRERLMQVREKLETFCTDLHETDPQWNLSVHDLLEKLAAITAKRNAPRTRVRFSAQSLDKITDIGKDRTLAILQRGYELGLFSYESRHNAWANCKITNRQTADRTIERVKRLHENILPVVRSQSARVAGEIGVHQALTANQWIEQIKMFDGISRCLDYFLPKIFEGSVQHLIALTATKEWRAEHGITLSRAEKRMYRRELEDLLRPGAAPADLNQELIRVESQREIWKRYTKDGSWPTLPNGIAQIQSGAQILVAELTSLSSESGIDDLHDCTFAQLTTLTESLIADLPQMEVLPERNSIIEKVNRLGLEKFVNDLYAKEVSPEKIAAEFELAYTSSVFEQLLSKSDLLATLGPRDLTALREEYCKLDMAHVNSLSTPVSIAVINNMRSYARANRNDTIRLDQLLAKYGISVLRDVIATYSRLVQLARPIWIVPPLLAREYIPQMHWVDLVICDTAQNTKLAAVIPILLRGRQIVLVGDRRRNELVHADAYPAVSVQTAENPDVTAKEQNRQTVSVERIVEESNETMKIAEAGEVAEASEDAGRIENNACIADEDADPAVQVAGGNSVVEKFSSNIGDALAYNSFSEIFPVMQLPTLRVQHEEIASGALLAHGYKDVYLPIPVCARKRNSNLIQVDGRGVPSASGDGAIESPTVEVDAVIDLILNYALDRNPDSLAVITVSPLHARQIRKALYEARTSSVILERFMRQNETEPFIITDISQTYGLRRDHVILSPGFGKTVHGRVLHSFGQLQEPGGFLDLIDSLEVARKSLTVVSSLGVGDIDTSRVSTPGPKLLAQIIAAAADSALTQAEPQETTSDQLLADLGERLGEAGFKVGYDYGFRGSRKLPMVVANPGSERGWELAVLIDDTECTSSLRRRERFYPKAVASRGWLIYQTFSTSLFIDPAGQAKEIAAMLEAVTPLTAMENPVPPNFTDEEWVEEPLRSELKNADTENVVAQQNSGKSVKNSFGDSEVACRDQKQVQDSGGAEKPLPRPQFTPGLQLSAYTDDQLDEVLAWIACDQKVRTHGELVEALRAELGIMRQGAQIDAVLGNVVRRSGFAK